MIKVLVMDTILVSQKIHKRVLSWSQVGAIGCLEWPPPSHAHVPPPPLYHFPSSPSCREPQQGAFENHPTRLKPLAVLWHARVRTVIG